MGEKDADSLAFYYIYRLYTSSWMKSKKNSKLISNLFLHANSAFSSLRWSKPLKDSTLFNQSAAPSQFIFWDVDLVGVNEISNRCPKGATMTLHPKQECVYTTERFQGVFSLVLNLATVSVTGIMRRYLLKLPLGIRMNCCQMLCWCSGVLFVHYIALWWEYAGSSWRLGFSVKVTTAVWSVDKIRLFFKKRKSLEYIK